jgi:hypothetical protein
MSDMRRREFITLRSDAADPAWGWMSLIWLAVVIGSGREKLCRPDRSLQTWLGDYS